MKQAALLAPRIECNSSPRRRYRLTWKLTWDDALPPCQFIGLSPSTADETGPDPTVSRCTAFAKAFDCGHLVMMNLFSSRATDPQNMKAEPEPVGPL